MDQINTKFYVYILCNQHRNVLYIGSTDNLKKRVYFYKKRLLQGFTKKYNVDLLVYFEVHINTDEALARERQLKGYRREKKVKLIEQMNSKWLDLYQNLC